MNQLELHKRIDEFLQKNPDETKPQEAIDLVDVNEDGKNFFFVQAGAKWLDWLWNNNFLDLLKQPVEDTTQYGWRTPEINFLVKVAGDEPAKVVEIILDDELATTEDKFRPELIDQILRLCSEMKAEYLVKVIPKIKEQEWVKLTSRFAHWGFQYEKMFETLYSAKEYESLLMLAEAVLSIRTKEEMKETSNGIKTDDPFYFDDLSQTKVFEYLVKIDNKKYAEKVFELTTKVMSKIALTGNKADEDSAFPIEDVFHLFDVDFFDLKSDPSRRLSYRNDVRELAALAKTLSERLMGSCAKEDTTEARRLFETHIGMFDSKEASLPNTKAMWRFRLFVLSLCPKEFEEELKHSFNILFDADDYWEIISGTEYEVALQRSFNIFSDKEKRDYIDNVIAYFVKKEKEKENEDENWHKTYGNRLFTVLKDDPIVKEKEGEIKEAGFKFIKNYKPEPSITGGDFAQRIISRAPITQEEFDQLPIEEMVENLKTIWTPEELVKQNKNPDEDFARPLNAEGVGNLIKIGIANRFSDFIRNAPLFFENNVLHPHYTDAFLRGVQDNIKNNLDTDYKELIQVLVAIRNAGEANELKEEKKGERKGGFYDTWIAGWRSVHQAMTDVLQELLSDRDGKTALNLEKRRDDVLAVLQYLLSYPDPTPKSEEIETAGMKTKSAEDDDYVVSDPYTMAINSVRGRAFQALLGFVFQDGKEFEKEDKIKIKSDVKDVYEGILKSENTRALMFMHGHHLPTFYYRDKDWIRELLSDIFSKDNKYLNLAAIEGYLTQTLYKEMFKDDIFQKLYTEWIDLEDTKYPNQKHFKEIDEVLATHLALAFIHFGIEIEENELLKSFWASKNTTRHKAFISFIGRSVLTRSGAGDKWMEENNVKKERLIDFWDWALKNVRDEDALSAFGFWINPDKAIFGDSVVVKKLAQTMEKSEGAIEWSHGFFQRIEDFAHVDPENTLTIIRWYLLDKDNNLNQHRRVPMTYQDEMIKALKVIYATGVLNDRVEELVNTMIEKGGQMFWNFKDVLKDVK